MPTIRESLINAEVYRGGNRLMGVANVTLPEMNFLTAEVKGMGIAGSQDVPIIGHLENPQLKISWRILYSPALTLMRGTAHELTVRCALQSYNSSTGQMVVEPLKVEVRGRISGTNLGELNVGEAMGAETTVNCDYIKITFKSDTVVEYDAYNFRYLSGGVDYMAEVRTALGL